MAAAAFPFKKRPYIDNVDEKESRLEAIFQKYFPKAVSFNPHKGYIFFADIDEENPAFDEVRKIKMEGSKYNGRNFDDMSLWDDFRQDITRPETGNESIDRKIRQEKKAAQEILASEYKIHLMPKPEYIYDMVDKLMAMLKEDPELRKSISAFKVVIEPGHVDKNGAPFPSIVIYPHLGAENANRVMKKIQAAFSKYSEELGTGVTPRYNQKVDNLIYYSQGGGDLKNEWLKNWDAAKFGPLLTERGRNFAFGRPLDVAEAVPNIRAQERKLVQDEKSQREIAWTQDEINFIGSKDPFKILGVSSAQDKELELLDKLIEFGSNIQAKAKGKTSPQLDDQIIAFRLLKDPEKRRVLRVHFNVKTPEIQRAQVLSPTPPPVVPNIPVPPRAVSPTPAAAPRMDIGRGEDARVPIPTNPINPLVFSTINSINERKIAEDILSNKDKRFLEKYNPYTVLGFSNDPNLRKVELKKILKQVEQSVKNREVMSVEKMTAHSLLSDPKKREAVDRYIDYLSSKLENKDPNQSKFRPPL